MLRIGCIFLAVCLVLISFTSCSRVPREAETIYPCVEGRRIPFEVLATGECRKDFGCFVVRSRKDAKELVERNLPAASRLMKVDYSRYAVIWISRWYSYFIPGTVIELIDRDGDLGVIYESLWREGVYIMDTEDRKPHYYALLLVRKKDLEGMELGEKLEVPYTQYICFLYDPERFVKQ